MQYNELDSELSDNITPSNSSGIPLIYLNKVIVVLEPPSDSSLRYNARIESSKSALKGSEETILKTVKYSY